MAGFDWRQLPWCAGMTVAAVALVVPLGLGWLAMRQAARDFGAYQALTCGPALAALALIWACWVIGFCRVLRGELARSLRGAVFWLMCTMPGAGAMVVATLLLPHDPVKGQLGVLFWGAVIGVVCGVPMAVVIALMVLWPREALRREEQGCCALDE